MLTKKDSLKSEVKTSKAQKTASQPAERQQEKNQKTTNKPYAPSKHQESSEPHHSSATLDKKIQQKTRVAVKYNVGYGNQLYIRGKGANLSWDKGIPLKNTRADEWVWETDQPFSHCEFKVLINDRNYENGENHHLHHGASIVYTPHFYHS